MFPTEKLLLSAADYDFNQPIFTRQVDGVWTVGLLFSYFYDAVSNTKIMYDDLDHETEGLRKNGRGLKIRSVKKSR